MEVAVCAALSETQLARLKQAAGDAAVRLVAADEPCSSAIVFGNPEPDSVAANANLRWLQLESAGFGEYAHLHWSRPCGNAVVTNLAGFFADPVAESALAGILALYRGIDSLVRLQTDGVWGGDPLRTRLRLLRGSRVLLFGYGSINARLAELLVPFGCHITKITRSSPPAEFDQALSDADLVVCTAPSTPATTEVFDTARLGMMKPGSVLCNFGRGSLLDEDALADALQAKRIAGAVIDVTQDEPLAPDHRFWKCPNLILTQHSGGGTPDEIDRKIDVFLANLARFRTGEPLQGVVDFSRGY